MGADAYLTKQQLKNIKEGKSMKMKNVLIVFGLIIVALAFIGSQDVEATNCYYLYFCGGEEECSFYDVLTWNRTQVALHKDSTWEGGPDGTAMSGNWYNLGNAFCMYVFTSDESLLNKQWLCGVKAGAVKINWDNIPKSKMNITKGQGFIVGGEYLGTWYLKKVKNDQCPWISE